MTKICSVLIFYLPFQIVCVNTVKNEKATA